MTKARDIADRKLDGENLEFGDNDKATFGAGADLEIFHTGTHNYIQQPTDNGNTYIAVPNGRAIVIESGTDGKNIASFTAGAGASLGYNGVEKFVTTAAGVKLTGASPSLEIANTDETESEIVMYDAEGATQQLAIKYDASTNDARIRINDDDFLTYSNSSDNIAFPTMDINNVDANRTLTLQSYGRSIFVASGDSGNTSDEKGAGAVAFQVDNYTGFNGTIGVTNNVSGAGFDAAGQAVTGALGNSMIYAHAFDFQHQWALGGAVKMTLNSDGLSVGSDTSPDARIAAYDNIAGGGTFLSGGLSLRNAAVGCEVGIQIASGDVASGKSWKIGLNQNDALRIGFGNDANIVGDDHILSLSSGGNMQLEAHNGTGDTRDFTINSVGVAAINVRGDVNNTGGEPGGALIAFNVDGGIGLSTDYLGRSQGTNLSPARATMTNLPYDNAFILGGQGEVVIAVNADGICMASSGAWMPTRNGGITLGESSRRWGQIYSTSSSISTSDETLKQDISDLSAAEKNVALAIKGMLKTFRFKDAVAEKGDDARIHVGVIAQEVKAAFEAEGLDAHRYGLFCWDKTYTATVTIPAVKGKKLVEAAKYEIDPETGDDVLISPAVFEEVVTREAYEETQTWGSLDEVQKFIASSETPDAEIIEGEIYSIRYEELLAFVIAAI